MSAQRILVVDDDQKIRTLLRNVFEGAGYDVVDAESASRAIALAQRERFDLVTLDLQLGHDDGLDVARALRGVSSVPIIMVTGRDDVVDRVVGLELGADDYITKPFHLREVLARARSVIRRSARDTQSLTGASAPEQGADAARSPGYVFDGLTIVPERFELYGRDGQLCDMTSADFRLLTVFVENAKRVLSRDRLMDLTAGVEWNPLDRAIDNQVARLRKKIEREPANPRLIRTVRGIGYSFACDVLRVQSDASPSKA